MRPNDRLSDAEATQRVEALLRAAARDEPSQSAPEHLAERALARWRAARQRRCRRRRAFWMTSMAPVGALLILLLARAGGGGADRPLQQAAEDLPPPRLAKAAPPPAVRPARPLAAHAGHAPRPVAVAPRAAEVRSVHTAAGHSQRAQHRTWRPAPAQRPLAAQARWQVETVRRDTYGVIAPVWLAGPTKRAAR